ncbi:MAG: cystathionine beta-lyase, partial [Brevundimonas sp.]|nr:cystathionine beta-lyase [Brevundimonas sp.]
LAPGSLAATEALLDSLEVFGLGFSWGGFESLAIHCDPQLSTRKFRPEAKGPLVRLHIGLEAPGDLIADLAKGLATYR